MPSSKQKNASQPGSSQLFFALMASLAAIVIFASPAAIAVRTARKAAALINLGEIGKAYDAYVHANSATRRLSAQPGEDAHAAAAVLARTGQLNDAIVWFVSTDPKLNGDSTPAAVLSGNVDSSSLNPDFASKTLSYDVVANIDLAPPPPIPAPNATNLPIAWTRGLRDDGTWAPDSPWQGEGGDVLFLDGHVTWFNKVTTLPGATPIYIYGTTTPTTNIRAALPPGAIILPAETGPDGQ